MSESAHRAAPWAPQTILSSRRFWFVMAAIVIGLLPMIFTDSYWRTNLIVCTINVLLAIGLDFVLGYAGQLNLGQSAFYGIGAYASTLLIMKLGVPFWPSFLCAVLIAGFAGMLLSLFAVRLRGHYLAIASLGFAVITYQILLNWISLTEGPLGIYAIAPPPPLKIPGLPIVEFSNLASLFYLAAGFTLLTYILLDQLVRSPIGETLTAIREDEISAASLGVNCNRWKVFAFAISSAVAGAAGCFYASFVGTLVPDAFFITEFFHNPGDGHCRGDGDADRTGAGSCSVDSAARTFARHWRLASDRLRRLGHTCRALFAWRHCSSRATLRQKLA